MEGTPHSKDLKYRVMRVRVREISAAAAPRHPSDPRYSSIGIQVQFLLSTVCVVKHSSSFTLGLSVNDVTFMARVAETSRLQY